MKCCLLVDHRERMVTQYAEECWQNIMYEIQTLTIGDYIIVDNQRKPLAVIERKTYEDFGASIKGTRIHNRGKMYDFARDYNCRVIFLIEGVAIPNKEDESYGGVKWTQIRSCLDHMIIRDNICVLYTGKDEYSNNARHTARFLATFCKNMETLLSNDLEFSLQLESRKCLQNVKIPLPTPGIEEEVMQAWRAIKGIGAKKAHEMMKKQSLCEYIDEARPDLTVKIAILEKIKQISRKSASVIVEHFTRNNLSYCKVTRNELADIMIEGRRIGKKGEKIHEILNYKSNTEQTEEDNPQQKFQKRVVLASKD